MFEIETDDKGHVRVSGRLDAARAPQAQTFLDRVDGPCVIDMQGLEYISSAGLGVLLRTHKRLLVDGQGVRLVGVGTHLQDIFTYSGFDRLFDIEAATDG
ncbi:STAS domain-containing protein [Marinihelvus fidelis]|uniref:Anti-sigma factor antagonist n=1 Tax=Marinihelvus fidelis TaxID=2613842 RepID=A0A5N0TEB8_9GAMM|nr:STAS domain-containing protein [Marinihelvus fidelis]KAA9133330.1 STAS domain-containing protein [Marinihelvus fidelis]